MLFGITFFNPYELCHTNHILDISHSSFGSSFSSNTLKGIEKPKKKKNRVHKNLETKENNNLPLNERNLKNK
jgi:hypothetical protein